MLAGFVGATWNVWLQKRPCPLRKPLDKLDRSALHPYEWERSITLSPDTLNSLGTDQYLQWVLEDVSLDDANSPIKRAILFITYYTGEPDPVPHIPDVCYLGSGFDIAASDDREMQIPELGRTVPVRLLEFERVGRGAEPRLTVLYTFHTNGQFATGRNQVRTIVGNPFEEYAYFCKVELRFESRAGQSATRDELMEGGTKLFRRLLPLLIEQHLPDWAALHDRSARAGAPASAVGDGNPRGL